MKRAVQGILENFPPDYIILETSGLANPLNLLEEMTEPGEAVRFDSTVTLVDALNLDADESTGLDLNRKKSAAGSVLQEASSMHPAHAEAGLWSIIGRGDEPGTQDLLDALSMAV